MSVGEIFYIGKNIFNTILDGTTNSILAQIGNVVEGYVDADKSEVWQQTGFSSRCSPPVAGASAAECIAIRGDRPRIIATRDVRSQAIYGNLKDGETCIYATGADGKAQGRVVIKQDGSINLFTTSDNTATGTSVFLRLGTGTDSQGKPDGLTFAAPWGTLKFDTTGFHVVTAAGARFDLGGIGGLPFPLSALGSYANIQAALVSAAASILSLGDPTTGSPAARAQPLVVFMGLVATALTALAGVVANPAPAAAAAAAVAAALPSLAGQVTSGTCV